MKDIHVAINDRKKWASVDTVFTRISWRHPVRKASTECRYLVSSCEFSWHRYENKYLVSERAAAVIWRICRAQMPHDPYSAAQSSGSYPIHSVYLDTPDLRLLNQTIERRANRCKLRVRSYHPMGASDSSGPLFFEIKRKLHGIIYKKRSRVECAEGTPILWGERSLIDLPSIQDSKNGGFLNDFLAIRDRLRARPMIGVFYTREAFEVTGNDRVRVTFDRDLHYGLLQNECEGGREMWWPVATGGVILEIKFTNTFPFWIADLVHRVEIQRRGICKYLLCSQSAGITRLGARFA